MIDTNKDQHGYLTFELVSSKTGERLALDVDEHGTPDFSIVQVVKVGSAGSEVVSPQPSWATVSKTDEGFFTVKVDKAQAQVGEVISVRVKGVKDGESYYATKSLRWVDRRAAVVAPEPALRATPTFA